MKIRQLEAVRAVLATGTTTQAAALLGLTQSAVSRLVTQLEDELGFSLFDRHRGRLVVSPQGREFYEVVEQILSGIDRIRSLSEDSSAHEVAALRVSAMPAIGSCMLPVPLNRVMEKHPQLKVNVQLMNRGELQAAMADGNYDIGLGTLPIKQKGVIVEPFCRVRAVCILPTGHRLASAPHVEAADLEGESFISIGADTILRYKTDQVFAEMNIRRSLTVEAQASSMVASLVAAGMGAAIIHPCVAEQFKDKVVIKDFVPTIELQYALLYPDGVPQPEIVKELAAHMRDCYGDQGVLAPSEPSLLEI